VKFSYSDNAPLSVLEAIGMVAVIVVGGLLIAGMLALTAVGASTLLGR